MIFIWNSLKKEIWKGLNWYFPKDAHQKSDGGQWGPILKKLDSFTLETSKNHLIRSFLRKGRLRVKIRYNDTSCEEETWKIFRLL